MADAGSTVAPLGAVEAAYPRKRMLQVFLDNARTHHAKLPQA
ncbi:hypothetical protein ACFQS7_07235 [Dankookia sp. GCM10030260]